MRQRVKVGTNVCLLETRILRGLISFCEYEHTTSNDSIGITCSLTIYDPVQGQTFE